MAGDKNTVVSGVVETIVYRNVDNDYTVLELVGDDDSLITATGILPYVAEGEEVILYGKWVNHAVYGRQFSAETYEKRLPSDVHAILRYLASGAVRGIGPSTATKIVNRYGEDTFEVMENHPEWLADIPGISAKKAAAISEAFREQTGVRAVMMFCRDFFNPAAAARIYKKFGAGAVGMMKENPYCLCDNQLGIGFEKADAIAASFGMEKTAFLRLQSGLRYILRYNAAANGHTCLPRKKLLSAAVEQLDVDRQHIETALSACLRNGSLETYGVAGQEDEKDYIYLPEYAAAEEYIAKKMLILDKHCASYTGGDIEVLVEKVEQEQGIIYAQKQREAIYRAMEGGMLIVTGGPGTGKTTVILALLRIFESLGHEVALAAPTGRAAKRMAEATGYAARTIHRMLEMERTSDDEAPRFHRNAQSPLEEDVIIIDEASMLDLPLMQGLLRAMRNGTRLVLIGDNDQLPSVGMGHIMGDVIASGLFPVVSLTEIFRQSQESLIVTNAHRINHGEMPCLDVTDNDFFLVEREREDQIAATISQLIHTRLPRAYGADVAGKIQVITPSRKGCAGTEVLNRLLQEQINPPAAGKKERHVGRTVLRVGDRVMQVRNNYEIEWEKNGLNGTGIFNGDIGVILDIVPPDETVYVQFDDRLAKYDFGMLDELEHAYAITVHKSQGSEYPLVIMPLYRCAPMLLTRNLLYTAITRAKEKVVLVGRRDVATAMVANNRHDMRYTGLLARLLAAAEDRDAL